MFCLVFVALFVGIDGATAEVLGGYVGSLPAEPELSNKIAKLLKELPSKQTRLDYRPTEWHLRIKNNSEAFNLQTRQETSHISVSIGSLKITPDVQQQFIYAATNFVSNFTGTYVARIPAEHLVQRGKVSSWTTQAKRGARLFYYVDYTDGHYYGGLAGGAVAWQQDEHWDTELTPIINKYDANDQARQTFHNAATKPALNFLENQIVLGLIDVKFVENKIWTKLVNNLASLLAETVANVGPFIPVLDVTAPGGAWTATNTRVNVHFDIPQATGFRFIWGPDEASFYTCGFVVNVTGDFKAKGEAPRQWSSNTEECADGFFIINGDLSDPSSLKLSNTEFSSSFGMFFQQPWMPKK